MITLPPILQRIKQSVLSTDPNATLILFGSYARGEQREDSDIDILILIDTEKISHDDRDRIGDPICGIELETGKLISPMILPKKWWTASQYITPFYRNVKREGIKL